MLTAYVVQPTRNCDYYIKELINMTKNEEVVSMRQLLECGVHFGHQTKRWNPKMKKYIFTSRNGIHVIDLQQSIKLIKVAYDFVKETVAKGGKILFVGTKKQAQDSIKIEAEKCDMPYVQHRWLGGTLTNHVTIRKSINKIKEYERLKEDGTLDQLSNKEASKRTKAYNRLVHYLGGIKNMKGHPSALFVIDTNKEQLAIEEANKLGIPIIGVVDTNANPNDVQYPIPANDDAIRAVKLLCGIISDAIQSAENDKKESTDTPEPTATSEPTAPTKKETPDEKKEPEQKKSAPKESTVGA